MSSPQPAFVNAPVSQFWVFFTSTVSVLSWAFHFRDSLVIDRHSVFNWSIWRAFTSPFPYNGATEMVMGLVLLQQLRIIERRMGSNKYAGLTFLSASLASLLQVSSIALFPGRNLVFSGPNAIIFASLVQFFMDVPSLQHFRFCGLPMSEKLFTYLLAFALVFMQNGSSALNCGFGILIGSLYRLNGVGLSNFRFPLTLQNAATRLFSPILGISTTRTAGPVAPTLLNNPNTRYSQTDRTATNNGGLFANRREVLNDFEQIPEHLRDHVVPSEVNINTLVEMGFTRERAMEALGSNGDSVELALNSLMN